MALNVYSVNLSGGVTRLNALTGVLELIAGSNITITPGAESLTISASGGGGGSSRAITGCVCGKKIMVAQHF